MSEILTEFANWMGLKNSKHRCNEIDCVLEYLNDKNMLNKSGREFAHKFWEKYIRDGKQWEN